MIEPVTIITAPQLALFKKGISAGLIDRSYKDSKVYALIIIIGA